MNAHVYARQSSDRTGDEFGVTRQLDDCRELAGSRGWVVAAEHVDNDVSASGKRKRPAFDALIASVETGTVRVVIAWSLDRLTRNRADTVRLIEVCQRHAVTVSLVRGSDLDMSTPAGRLVADILASVARSEIEVKGDRQRRAQEQAAKDGRRVGGRKPFGWSIPDMQLIPAEADAIRRAHGDVLAGVPLGEIARQWNTEGLVSGQANKDGWKHDTVRMVLLNPRNAGQRHYLGQIVSAAKWAPIVPLEQHLAVVSYITNPTRNSGGTNHAGQRLLTGVALCSVCGRTVHGGGGSHGRPIYRCSNQRDAHGGVNRVSAPVDQHVSEIAIARLSAPNARAMLIDRERPDTEALRAEVNAKRKRLDQIAVEFANDETVTPSQLRAMTSALVTRIATVEAQMADAGRVDVLGPLVNARNPRAVWDGLSTSKRRAVISAMMTVRLHPTGRGTRHFREDTVECIPIKGSVSVDELFMRSDHELSGSAKRS